MPRCPFFDLVSQRGNIIALAISPAFFEFVDYL